MQISPDSRCCGRRVCSSIFHLCQTTVREGCGLFKRSERNVFFAVKLIFYRRLRCVARNIDTRGIYCATIMRISLSCKTRRLLRFRGSSGHLRPLNNISFTALSV